MNSPPPYDQLQDGQTPQQPVINLQKPGGQLGQVPMMMTPGGQIYVRCLLYVFYVFYKVTVFLGTTCYNAYDGVPTSPCSRVPT